MEKQKIHISEPMFMQTVINRKKSSRPKVGTDTQRTDAQQSLVVASPWSKDQKASLAKKPQLINLSYGLFISP